MMKKSLYHNTELTVNGRATTPTMRLLSIRAGVITITMSTTTIACVPDWQRARQSSLMAKSVLLRRSRLRFATAKNNITALPTRSDASCIAG